MPVGTAVCIVDKDGGRVVELDSLGNLPVFIGASGDKVFGGVFVQPGTLNAPVGVIKNRNAEYSSAQTGTVIWTPASGKRIYLYGVAISTNVVGAVRINMGDIIVVPNYYVPAANAGPNMVTSGGVQPIWEAPSGDARLEVTSTCAGAHSVLLWGTEV